MLGKVSWQWYVVHMELSPPDLSSEISGSKKRPRTSYRYPLGSFGRAFKFDSRHKIYKWVAASGMMCGNLKLMEDKIRYFMSPFLTSRSILLHQHAEAKTSLRGRWCIIILRRRGLLIRYSSSKMNLHSLEEPCWCFVWFLWPESQGRLPRDKTTSYAASPARCRGVTCSWVGGAYSIATYRRHHYQNRWHRKRPVRAVHRAQHAPPPCAS